MKKTIVLICSFLFLLGAVTMVYGVDVLLNENKVFFNEQSGSPFTDESGRVQVPLRVTMESFGAEVTWNEVDKKATISKGNVVVEVPIGKPVMYVNGKEQQLDTSALVKANKTYLPIRPVA